MMLIHSFGNLKATNNSGRVNRVHILELDNRQFRPRIAHPQTAVSVIHEGSYVIAIPKGRGVPREVGIAAPGNIMLVQVITAIDLSGVSAYSILTTCNP